MDILEFLNSQAQYLHSLLQLQQTNPLSASSAESKLKVQHVQMALEALHNVIKNNPGQFSIILTRSR